MADRPESEPRGRDSGPLSAAVREVEAHAAAAGWDRPAALYALVPTDQLLAKEPQLAVSMGLDTATAAGSLTPVTQEPLASGQSFERSLEQVGWPAEVVGAAVVLERVVLPPAAERHVPTDPQQAARYAATHPDHQDVRMAAGVLRDGRAHCVLRIRSHDDAIVEGPELVPDLVRILAATMQD
jgi:hypothetical protein